MPCDLYGMFATFWAETSAGISGRPPFRSRPGVLAFTSVAGLGNNWARPLTSTLFTFEPVNG